MVIAGSLLVFLGQQAAEAPQPAPLVFAYALPAGCALAIACFAWLRFRLQASGWWLGIASSFFLFFVLTGEQALIECLDGWGGFRADRLPWQPWNAARVVLAAGVLSAFATPRGLLPQSGRASRTAAWTVVTLAMICCPVWPGLLPVRLYHPSSFGFSTIDTVFVVAGGLALVWAILRTRAGMGEGQRFIPILSGWLLALGWSVVCRAFPLVSPDQAVWVEMMVIGTASILTVAHLTWVVTGARARYESEMLVLKASRDVLADVLGSKPEHAGSAISRAAVDKLGCEKAMLVLKHVGAEAVTVAAVHPEGAGSTWPGAELSLESQRRGGFGTGPAAKAMKERKPVIVEEVASDVDFVAWEDVAAGSAYQVTVPIPGEDESAGALLMWYPQALWRPWEVLPVAEAVAESLAPLLWKMRPVPGEGEQEQSPAHAA